MRALELAQEAEGIAQSAEDPDIIRANIERYRRMLAAGVSDEAHKQIIENMLADAEEMLKGISGRG